MLSPMRNRSSLFSWIAALGLLLHATTAAATMWCSMTGTLSMGACACSAAIDESQDLLAEAHPGSCCTEAIEAQEIEPGSYEPSLAGPLISHQWEVPSDVASAERGRSAKESNSDPPTPLLELKTIILIC